MGKSLLLDNGEPFSLKHYRGKKVVLYFYPKDMTTGCTQEACDFQSALKKLNSKDAVVIGVSKDSVELHQKFKTKYKLKFPLVSDPDAELIQKFDVWKEKSMYGRKYMGIERSTFVLDEQGKIIAEFRKVKIKGHVEEVLKTLA